MTQYNTGNAVPSSDMPDAWDNNATIDIFVNSPDFSVTTRTGVERDTMAGIEQKSADQREQIAADGAAVVEATRQNLIPLSRQYMTLAAAQADIANIPDGSTTYYRSPDDSALAIEVINTAGTLVPTGRKMPSQYALERYFQELPDGSLVISGENGAVLVIDKTAATHLVELIIQSQIRIGGLGLAQGDGVPFMVMGDNGIPLALSEDGTLRTVGVSVSGSGLSGDSLGVPLLISGGNGVVGAVDKSGALRIPAVITDELHVAGKKITGNGGGSDPAFSGGDRYIDADGNVMPVLPDNGKMSAWGSSSFVVAGASANFSTMAQELGVTDWNNQGQGGESSFQVAARWGAIPFTLVFPGNVIPASGTVAVTCTQLPSNFCNNFLKT
ncbi:hypothetical protein ACTWOF_005559, partial [Klebsiella michiganensis]